MTEGSTRPDWTALEVVETGNLLLRLLRRECFLGKLPKGARVQTSACSSREFHPRPDSYGASVFVDERLENGPEDLYTANARWREYMLVRVPVEDVTAIEGLYVRYSPQDCQFTSIAHAHASIIGITPARRNAFIRLLDRLID